MEVAIGIDLGTTNSCVGIARSGSAKVEIVQNKTGHRVIKSCVSFESDGKEKVFGKAAMSQIAKHPKSTIFNVKRIIGREFADEAVQSARKDVSFEVIDDNGYPLIEVITEKGDRRKFEPHEISGMILSHLKESALDLLDYKKDSVARASVKVKAVITVPANFNASQRQATKNAAKEAGLDVIRLLNEPTAAAVGYGFINKKEKPKTIVVFDLGGGTFDVSILRLEKNTFTVLATGGDTNLGGNDFTTNLVEYCMSEFVKGKQLQLKLQGLSARNLYRLRHSCEEAKIELSERSNVEVYVDCIYEEMDLSVNVSQALFNKINDKNFQKCEPVLGCALQDAGVKAEDVDTVVMVGGATRMVKVTELVQRFFPGKALSKGINPDEAVATGATVIANGWNNPNSDWPRVELRDVIPFSLNLKCADCVFTELIPRNTEIPTSRTNYITTSTANQSEVILAIYQSEGASQSTLLDKFVLTIPPGSRKGARIEVTLEVNIDLIFSVSARDNSSNPSIQLQVSPDRVRHLDKALSKEPDGRSAVLRGKAECDNEIREPLIESFATSQKCSLFGPCIAFLPNRCYDWIS